MRVFVANTTLARHTVEYRKPTKIENGKQLWSDKLYSEPVEPGQQIMLAGDFTAEEFAKIFKHQAEFFGAVRAGDQPKGFRGLIWGEKATQGEKIEESIAANQDAAQNRSEKLLDNTAAAMLKTQSEAAQRLGTSAPTSVRVEVIPEDGKGKVIGGGVGAEALQPGVEPEMPNNRGK